jgi:PTS system nitrogen regulatory IIA component
MDLSLAEIAAGLNVTAATLERWIRQGRIPVNRTGNAYRFNLSVLERWAETHDLTFALPEMAEKRSLPPRTGLAAAIERGGVYHGIPGDSVTAVLRSAVGRLTMLPEDIRDDLYDQLVRRERLASTGIGRGVAIPHPRSPVTGAAGLLPLIATAFLESPVDFQAVDDQPVFVLFILLSDSIDSHLHLLSRLAFCLRDDGFSAFLRACPGPGPLLERTAAFEGRLDNRD